MFCDAPRSAQELQTLQSVELFNLPQICINYKPYSELRCSIYHKYAYIPWCSQERPGITNPTVSWDVQFTFNMHTFCDAPRSAQELQTLQSVELFNLPQICLPGAPRNYKPYSQLRCSIYLQYAHILRCSQERPGITNPTVSWVVQFTVNMHIS